MSESGNTDPEIRGRLAEEMETGGGGATAVMPP